MSTGASLSSSVSSSERSVELSSSASEAFGSERRCSSALVVDLLRSDVPATAVPDRAGERQHGAEIYVGSNDLGCLHLFVLDDLEVVLGDEAGVCPFCGCV